MSNLQHPIGFIKANNIIQNVAKSLPLMKTVTKADVIAAVNISKQAQQDIDIQDLNRANWDIRKQFYLVFLLILIRLISNRV